MPKTNMPKIFCLIISIIFSFLFITTSYASDVIASVGKQEITKKEAEFATKMAGLADFNNLPVDSKKVIVKKLINDKVIEELAKKEKFTEQEEIVMAIRAIIVAKYIEKHLGDIESLAKKKYNEASLALKGKKTYTLSHILVKEESEANNIYKNLSASANWKSDFKKLAKEKSLDTATAKNGGLVGTIAEVKLPEDFVPHLKNAKANTLIKPFKTKLGYHIVTVEKIKPVHIEPYDKVKNIFMAQVFQEETENLAKKSLKGKEIKFKLDSKS